jgi:hypothetical protein
MQKYDVDAAGDMQSYGQPGTGGSAGLLVWLVWLLPRLAAVVVVAFGLSMLGFDLRVAAQMIVTGHGGEVLATLAALVAWAGAQTGRAVVDNWVIVILGVTLAALIWAIRYL